MHNTIMTDDRIEIEARLRPFCAEFHGRRIFLTGGTGFFGKWLLHSFLMLRQSCKRKPFMTVLSRDPSGFLHANPEFHGISGLEIVAGDIRTFSLPDFRTFDFVIHGATAASAKLEQDNPEEMFSVITDGTRRVLEFATQRSATRFLFVSSGGVYGPQPLSLNHVPETYTGTPTTAYGKGKKESEDLCLKESAGNFDCVIARPFAFVGPHLPLDAHFAIGNFIRDCLEDRPIVIQGDGTPLRSYLYAADLAEWLWTILLRGEHARAYNVGSSAAISIGELAHLVRECAGTQNEIIVCGKKSEGALPARYVPSVDRVRNELGLCQRYSLPDSIRRTIAWHRALQVKGVLR